MSSHIDYNGGKVYYEIIGSGPNPILIIPDAIGTSRTDFGELLDGEDELNYDKFTAIAVDPPGWGRSRPPIRHYGNKYYSNDCECYHQLMEQLGYKQYSIVGYSEGARVALLMAAEYPDSITSLILSALSTHTTNNGMKALMASKTVEKWPKKRIDAYLTVYETKEEIQKLWNRYLKFVEFFPQYFPEDIFKPKVGTIQCPVLFTHGDMDPITEVEQPLECRTIRLSTKFHNMLNTNDIEITSDCATKVHRFPLGEKDSHRKYAPTFTKLVQDHILNSLGN